MPKYKTGKEKMEKVESNIPEEFRQSLIDKKMRPATLKSYVDNDTIPFICYLREEKKREFDGRFTRTEIEDYLIYLKEKNYAVATYNKKCNSLYVFNRYLIERKLMTEQVITLKDRITKTKAGVIAEPLQPVQKGEAENGIQS